MKGKKTGGRAKGTVNKRTQLVEDIAAKFDIDPFEVLMMVAAGDWEGLGFDAASKISYTSAGIEFEEPNIKLTDRVQAAKEASKYLYSQKQSVALSSDDKGITVVLKDYTQKE